MAASIEDPISQRQRCTAIPAVLASRGEGCSRFRELAGIQPGIVDGDQAPRQRTAGPTTRDGRP